MEKMLVAERARDKRSERNVAAGAKKRPMLLVRRREMSEAASRQLAKNRESLQKLHSKAATTIAELREWCKLATEASEELKVVKANAVLLLRLCKAAWEDVDPQTSELSELQEQLGRRMPNYCSCQQNTAK